MGNVNSDKKEKKQNVKMSYLFELAGSKKATLYAAIMISILSGICTFVPYIMTYKTILFLFEENKSISVVMQYGLIAAVFIILKFAFRAISTSMTHIGAYKVLYEVRKKICIHIGKINLGFFTDNSTGEIKKVLMEDVDRLERFIAHQIPDITVAIVVPLLVLIYMFTINVPMALVLLLPIVLQFLIQCLMLVAVKPLMNESVRIVGRLNTALLQFINGMTVMKAYNMTADSYKEYYQANEEYNDFWIRGSKIAAPMSAVGKVIIDSGIFFTIPLGGYLYLSGSLELGSFIFFVIISIVFLASHNNLMNFAQIFSQISSGLVRIKEVMDTPEMNSQANTSQAKTGQAETSQTKASESKTWEHKVTFSNVTFAYKEKEVLRNITITLPRGSLTAFVGASGAGKSTAAQLIPRFWDVTKGSISIADNDIRTINNADLMDMVSFVFQEAFMLDDTVYENIAIGKPDCTQEDVEKAARAAQIHDFIMTLPKGYKTQIGTQGVKMSGGEKQRICIARAMLKDAPIIIFDEATSFTDMENERKIQVALGNLLENKTTVMIAHRLHTIVNADQICVFDNGEIVETGTHNQLIKENGTYKKMWDVYNEQGVEVLEK